MKYLQFLVQCIILRIRNHPVFFVFKFDELLMTGPTERYWTLRPRSLWSEKVNWERPLENDDIEYKFSQAFQRHKLAARKRIVYLEVHQRSDHWINVTILFNYYLFKSVNWISLQPSCGSLRKILSSWSQQKSGSTTQLA